MSPPISSSVSTPSLTRAVCWAGGHWLSRNTNAPPTASSAARVFALAQRSNMLGRDGMMLRSATAIAASEAGPSAPGVSMIASEQPLALN